MNIQGVYTALVTPMRGGEVDYETLRKLVEMLREMRGNTTQYPSAIDTDGKKALYDNLDNDETLALRTYIAIREHAEVGFRENKIRLRALQKVIERVDGMPADKVDLVLKIAINNPEF